MALRFHARRKILRKFRLSSRIRPARYRAKAALLNSRTTPSKELTGHVIIYSHVVYSARQNTESFKFLLTSDFSFTTRDRLCASKDAYLNNFFPTLYIEEIRETTLWSEQSVFWNCSLNFSTGDVRWNLSHPRFDTYIVQNTFKYAEDWLRS